MIVFNPDILSAESVGVESVEVIASAVVVVNDRGESQVGGGEVYLVLVHLVSIPGSNTGWNKPLSWRRLK